MGSSGRYASSAAAESAAAKSSVQGAADRRFQTEEGLRVAEGLLGTDAQAEGNLFGDPRFTSEVVGRSVPYAGKFELDEEYIRTLEHAGGYGYKNTLAQGIDTSKYARLSDYARDLTGKANKIMETAGLHALAGNMKEAEAFKKQAEDLFNKAAPGLTANVGLGKGVNFKESDQLKAKAQLATPQAQTVGRLVKQGREFLDPNSQTSKAYKQSLTEEGQRAIAVEAETARRATRDFSAAGGAARNFNEESAMNNRLAAAVGRERADVYSKANAQYEQFSRAFAADSVTFAQQWLQGGAGVRESFQGAMDNLALKVADINMMVSDRYDAMASTARARENGLKDQKRGMITKAVGTLAGGAIGFALGGPAGAMMGAQIGGGLAGGQTPSFGGGGGGGGGDINSIPGPGDGSRQSHY